MFRRPKTHERNTAGDYARDGRYEALQSIPNDGEVFETSASAYYARALRSRGFLHARSLQSRRVARHASYILM